jgi:uncharacterized coiled-coil protein SlyX
MFDKLFELQNSVAGVCIVLLLLVLMKVGEFLWKMKEKKESLSEKAIERLSHAVVENTAAIKHLEMSLGELPKFKTDIRRFYAALKILAGDEWVQIRKEIMEEGDLNI